MQACKAHGICALAGGTSKNLFLERIPLLHILAIPAYCYGVRRGLHLNKWGF
jgi:hypothetical protein